VKPEGFAPDEAIGGLRLPRGTCGAMRALALTLIIAVPTMSFAQEKLQLSPNFEQPVSKKILAPEVAPTPLTHRWYFGTLVGVSIATLLAVVAFAGWAWSSRTPAAAAHSKSDFPCNPNCAGFLNPPSM
jgi:hypothetical protein